MELRKLLSVLRRKLQEKAAHMDLWLKTEDPRYRSAVVLSEGK